MNEFTVEELLDKAINKEKLTEEQWKMVVSYAEDNEIDEVEGKTRRWTRRCVIILPYKDKIYGVNYDAGLTEYQENDYTRCFISEVRQVVKAIKVWVFV